MNIIIAGGTGFIGRHLVELLLKSGHRVAVIGRSKEKITQLFSGRVTPLLWKDILLDGFDVVINLSGERVGVGKWTREKKAEIVESRVSSIERIFGSLERSQKKPRVFVQASAIGYYGDRGNEVLDENSNEGSEFLSGVVSEIEKRSRKIENLGIRTVVLRTAVVLAKDGGALPEMTKAFRFFLGGPVGKGDQFISWIHIDDEIGAIKFLLENESAAGPYNLSSPEPVTSDVFFRTVGRVLKRPAWFRLPSSIVKLLMGEKGRELLLSSKRVVPTRLTSAGYKFKHPTLEEALMEIFSD